MRLIDADALKKVMIETLEALLKNPKMDNQEAHLLAAFHTVGKMIDDAPTVKPIKVGDVCKECWRDGGNVVEVVRCNECRYANARTKDGKNVHCNLFAMWMSRECFCVHGKREDENRSD